MLLVLILLSCRSLAQTDTMMSVHSSHSAKTAMLLSIVPGAGQIYNHQAWKLPIIYGAMGVMGYLVYDNYTQRTMFLDEYRYRKAHGDTPQLPDYTDYPTSSIYNMYQSYDQYFQLMLIISAGVYALNLIDAYVFGHLFDFQINDDLSLNVQPGVLLTVPNTITPSMGFTLRF